MSDGFFQSDVDAYAALLNKTLLPIEVVPPNATHDPGGSEEGSLDIDMVLAMAPAAQVVAFIGSGDDDSGRDGRSERYQAVHFFCGFGTTGVRPTRV